VFTQAVADPRRQLPAFGWLPKLHLDVEVQLDAFRPQRFLPRLR
jgi:hypothetical protein